MLTYGWKISFLRKGCWCYCCFYFYTYDRVEESAAFWGVSYLRIYIFGEEGSTGFLRGSSSDFICSYFGLPSVFILMLTYTFCVEGSAGILDSFLSMSPWPEAVYTDID